MSEHKGIQASVLSAVKAGKYRAVDIAHAVGIPADKVYTHLRRLVSKGEVIKLHSDTDDCMVEYRFCKDKRFWLGEYWR